MIITEIVNPNANGDIEYKVINDTHRSLQALGWCMVFILACILCFFVQKWIVFPFLDAISCFFALCALVLMGFMYYRSRLIAKEEASLVTSAIHCIAKQDAIQQNQQIVKIEFFSDTLNPYGSIDEEYILVLLSDETVLKYQIKQLYRKDDQYYYKLIEKNFSVCTNKTQIQKISRPDLRYKITDSQTFITFIIWIMILGVLAIGAFIIFLFVHHIHDVYDAIALFLISLGLLAFIPLNQYIDKKLPKNRACNVIRFILSIPVFILKICNLIMPFLTILATIVFIFIFSFLPIFFIVIGIEFLGYSITLCTKLFVSLTFSSIIASQGSRSIRNIILRQAPFAEDDHYSQLFMRELVKFIYTKENLNFIIYAGYFLFLTVSTIKTLQTGGAILNEEIDLIVAKSFLVYMAYTTMFDKKKDSNIEGVTLLALFLKMMSCDDVKWTQKRKTHRLGDDKLIRF